MYAQEIVTAGSFPATESRLPDLRRSRRFLCLVLATGLLSVGCVTPPPTVAADPATDFAAHVDHRGLVVDRGTGGAPATLVSAGTPLWKDGPRYLLQANGQTLAALWNDRPGHMLVRQSADAWAPIVGEIDATWKEGAIRLQLTRVDGTVFRIGRFRREDIRSAPSMLSSSLISTNLDLSGTYRAEFRNDQGTPIGWVRVTIDPAFDSASRHYDADVPPLVNGVLTTAAIELVDMDIDWIEAHAQDVHTGT